MAVCDRFSSYGRPMLCPVRSWCMVVCEMLYCASICRAMPGTELADGGARREERRTAEAVAEGKQVAIVLRLCCAVSGTELVYDYAAVLSCYGYAPRCPELVYATWLCYRPTAMLRGVRYSDSVCYTTVLRDVGSTTSCAEAAAGERLLKEGQVSSYAVCGTGIACMLLCNVRAYAGTRRRGERRRQVQSAISLCVRYAMPGIELGYGARCIVLCVCYSLSGTELAYDATRDGSDY
eukprot:1255700-Rhodomonas_salina.2